VVGLEGFAEARGFDRSEAMVDIVEEMNVGAEFDAEFFEERWGEVEIAFCRPEALRGEAALCRFVGLAGFGDSVAGGDTGDS
jgi:hypothetical protein